MAIEFQDIQILCSSGPLLRRLPSPRLDRRGAQRRVRGLGHPVPRVQRNLDPRAAVGRDEASHQQRLDLQDEEEHDPGQHVQAGFIFQHLARDPRFDNVMRRQRYSRRRSERFQVVIEGTIFHRFVF